MRINNRYELPTGVVNMVKSICFDYERRARAIRYGSVCGEVLERYVMLNKAIEKGLESLDVDIRRDMLEDICLCRGYDFSMVSVRLAKNTYYLRKKRVIWEIAKALFLI
jgi:hypothetical protein